MIPHERSLVERYRDKPFALLGINYDSNPEHVRKFMADQGVSWRNRQMDASQDVVSHQWNISLLPAVYVVDAKGIVRHVNARGSSLDRTVAALVAEAEKQGKS